ncbi:MAG TPA: hypothetical protein PLM56_09670 [Cyclobacteriaceae bacterium]|jgi:hypothetical protein|nr:hypothetical protein [Cyclobacteriaceae bacterium]HRE67605.1 hypothetical protein [Cyclobacteriaceae bacterium]HRF33758.1 hypothetical protein [Cyclobacteriaceae bacterium]
MKKIVIAILLMAGSVVTQAQTKDYTRDVQSVDAIMHALYDVISGDPGVARDWDRFRFLFKSDARLIPSRKDDKGNFELRAISPEEYVHLFSSRISSGFFERELSRKEDAYGTVVHVFSTYETKEKNDGPVTNRGINSIQLFKDQHRYYIVNIFWCAESLGFPLPDKYLK